MKTKILSILTVLLVTTRVSFAGNFFGNLKEELSKQEMSKEGIGIMGGIIAFVVLGYIGISIADKIRSKKEKELQEKNPHPNIHHHHRHRHRPK